jgi:aryl-alcohol dehydrogenase-like predicted oxidoreductase
VEIHDFSPCGIYIWEASIWLANGFGCIGMSELYDPRNEAESVATIHLAVDLVVNFLGTADLYGVGHDEELVRKGIKGRRNGIARSGVDS